MSYGQLKVCPRFGPLGLNWQSVLGEISRAKDAEVWLLSDVIVSVHQWQASVRDRGGGGSGRWERREGSERRKIDRQKKRRGA